VIPCFCTVFLLFYFKNIPRTYKNNKNGYRIVSRDTVLCLQRHSALFLETQMKSFPNRYQRRFLFSPFDDNPTSGFQDFQSPNFIVGAETQSLERRITEFNWCGLVPGSEI